MPEGEYLNPAAIANVIEASNLSGILFGLKLLEASPTIKLPLAGLATQLIAEWAKWLAGTSLKEDAETDIGVSAESIIEAVNAAPISFFNYINPFISFCGAAAENGFTKNASHKNCSLTESSAELAEVSVKK